MATTDRLTKNDRLTLFLSVVAIVISIASPVASYYFLQASTRDQTLKAQGFTATGTDSLLLSLDASTQDQNVYTVRLRNDGALPVGDVIIALIDSRLDDSVKNTITTLPPVPFHAELQGDRLQIFLDHALPPAQAIDITLMVPYDKSKPSTVSAWVQTEASASVPVVWDHLAGAGI